jgi:hypothetical protein
VCAAALTLDPLRAMVGFAMRALLSVVAVWMGCGGVGPIAYEPINPSSVARPRTEAIERYEIDCSPTTHEIAPMPSRIKIHLYGIYAEHCFFHGDPIPWRVYGVFRASPEAAAGWPRYQEAVRLRAMEVGCPAVAVLRDGPKVISGDREIGALCVGPDDGPTKPSTKDEIPEDSFFDAPCSEDKSCGTEFKCKGGHCRP